MSFIKYIDVYELMKLMSENTHKMLLFSLSISGTVCILMKNIYL